MKTFGDVSRAVMSTASWTKSEYADGYREVNYGWQVCWLFLCFIGSEISGTHLPLSCSFSRQLLHKWAYFEGDCSPWLANKLATAGN